MDEEVREDSTVLFFRNLLLVLFVLAVLVVIGAQSVDGYNDFSSLSDINGLNALVAYHVVLIHGEGWQHLSVLVLGRVERGVRNETHHQTPDGVTGTDGTRFPRTSADGLQGINRGRMIERNLKASVLVF